jgi:hypothetical protein
LKRFGVCNASDGFPCRRFQKMRAAKIKPKNEEQGQVAIMNGWRRKRTR